MRGGSARATSLRTWWEPWAVGFTCTCRFMIVKSSSRPARSRNRAVWAGLGYGMRQGWRQEGRASPTGRTVAALPDAAPGGQSCNVPPSTGRYRAFPVVASYVLCHRIRSEDRALVVARVRLAFASGDIACSSIGTERSFCGCKIPITWRHQNMGDGNAHREP